MDQLRNAYADWIAADLGLNTKAAWKLLAEQGCRGGLETRDASSFVLRLQRMYPDLRATQPADKQGSDHD